MDEERQYLAEALTAAMLLEEVDGLRRKLDQVAEENIELARKNSELLDLLGKLRARELVPFEPHCPLASRPA